MAGTDRQEEEELVAVEDEEEEQGGAEDQEDEEEEQRLGAGEDEEEDEEKRATRREERKTRRQRQKDARARDDREMSFLRDRHESSERRINELESRLGTTEISGVDQRINQIKGQIKLADQVIAKSVEAQKGEDLVEAQNIRDGLRDNLRQLETAKTSMTAETKGGGEEDRPDPRMLRHAEKFMNSHDWWDPNGGDEDSLIVSAIDNALILERYDPTSEEYWLELADRVAERLPHTTDKAKDDDGDGGRNNQPKRGGGPRFRTGGRERPLKSNEVYISPDRKTAMVEAGIWDDPETRQRYLKQYAEWDRENQDA